MPICVFLSRIIKSLTSREDTSLHLTNLTKKYDIAKCIDRHHYFKHKYSLESTTIALQDQQIPRVSKLYSHHLSQDHQCLLCNATHDCNRTRISTPPIQHFKHESGSTQDRICSTLSCLESTKFYLCCTVEIFMIHFAPLYSGTNRNLCHQTLFKLHVISYDKSRISKQNSSKRKEVPTRSSCPHQSSTKRPHFHPNSLGSTLNPLLSKICSSLCSKTQTWNILLKLSVTNFRNPNLQNHLPAQTKDHQKLETRSAAVNKSESDSPTSPRPHCNSTGRPYPHPNSSTKHHQK